MTNQIPFGLQGAKFIHISEALRGLDCDCVCPGCGAPLIARKGQEREHHFAHANSANNSGCEGDTETVLHKYAKQVIEEARYLEVPKFCVQLEPPNEDLNAEIAARRAIFTRVELEENIIAGRRRVDVAGYSRDEKLLIEIHVTHRVHGKKLKEVKASNETMLEIGIPERALYSPHLDGFGSLRSAILDSLENKHWIHHPEGERMRARLRKQVRERSRLSLETAKQTMSDLALLQSAQNRGGLHVPVREEHSAGEYVHILHQVLDWYDDAATKRTVAGALRTSGNITPGDIELSNRLGLTLYLD